MRRILTILVLILSAVAVTAQSPGKPIRWRLSVTMESADTGLAIVRALITPGWHLYGLSLPENGPMPTTFSFANSSGIEITADPTPTAETVVRHDPQFGIDLSWWEDDVSFELPFKVTDENAVLSITVRYM